MIYLIGSLRNPEIPKIANSLREAGHEIFDDWYAAGPEADDKWREYEIGRGRSYRMALKGAAARNVFEFDRRHLERADAVILALPAGKSGHLELGWSLGQGKAGYILLDRPDRSAKLPDGWEWLAGVYEGEGTLTRNGRIKTGHGMQMSVTMKDQDIIRRLHVTSKVGSVEGPYKRNNPNWSDMWRWSVRKREDILYVLNGVWDLLGERRKEQARRVITEAGLSIDVLASAKSPKEYRFDVMYQFATGVFDNLEELIDELGQRHGSAPQAGAQSPTDQLDQERDPDYGLFDDPFQPIPGCNCLSCVRATGRL